MTTEDLMKLAENYARLCYEGDDGPLVINARQALLDALEAQGKEVERMGRQILSDTDAFIHVRDQRDTLRAELAAIRAQEPVGEVKQKAGYPEGNFFVLWSKLVKPGDKLYASPAASPDVGALVEALESVCTWMESQSEAQSKGSHATFDLMMLREQRDIASAALSSAQAAKDGV
jgi:hypothetical protein